VKDEQHEDELTPLVDAVATGRTIDWESETRELDVEMMRTAGGLQEIETIARAHRALLHETGATPVEGDAETDRD
jgi:hypothetical protein